GEQASRLSLRISPPLAAWEEEFFLRGLTENLFEINERGQVASELLPAGTEEDGAQKSYRIFSHEPVRLLRENVCQLASAARLIFERGWLKRHVRLEPSREEQRATADHFALLVRSPAGRIVIWMDGRCSACALDNLIVSFRA